jgi:hypothetical protein
MRVFLSYAREDFDQADRIEQQLGEEGVIAWREKGLVAWQTRNFLVALAGETESPGQSPKRRWFVNVRRSAPRLLRGGSSESSYAFGIMPSKKTLTNVNTLPGGPILYQARAGRKFGVYLN